LEMLSSNRAAKDSMDSMAGVAVAVDMNKT
jgi:hypothetical protein